MSQDHIRDFWDAQADEHGTDPAASWGDNWAIDLEVETIGKHLGPGDVVLDVGCANGHATLAHLSRGVQSIVGIDFSPAMIREAQKRREACEAPDRVDFRTGDVRQLEFDDEAFDVVYTTRVLINLPTWEEQKEGIRECVRVCRPGGKVVLSEGFWEPLVLLNAMRALVSLPPLVEHDFNRYLKMARLKAFLDDAGLPFTIDDFSSVYYLGSRFLRELVTDPDDWPGYSNPVNEAFHALEKEYSGGGFGIQQACVIRR